MAATPRAAVVTRGSDLGFFIMFLLKTHIQHEEYRMWD
jgi:hypothetical protein